ncbi:MAG: hypothetical protein KJZ65_01235 [Phycisphaerales bacterium]|nr:hypothetical protein [Phycisphaerales bacterium]
MVLAILGVFAGIAAPRFSAATNRSGVEQAADRITSFYSEATRLAQATSASVRVSCDPSRDLIMLTPPSGAAIELRLSREPYRVDIVACDFEGAAAVVVDGWGQADVDSTFLIRRGGAQLIVKIGSRTSDTQKAREGDALWMVLMGVLGL